MSDTIPRSQTVALVRQRGGEVEFVDDYPVPEPRPNEVLAKVLFTGVCQSDLHTARGTASGPDGNPITNIKFPHIGGHEGIGQVVRLGQGITSDDIRVGIYHEDGSFQQFIALDADYLTILPSDIEPHSMGPVLCAGLTTYKAVRMTGVKPGDWLVVIGAGGGLGHFAVQYARAHGARVIGVDGAGKAEYVKSLGAERFVDFEASQNIPADIIAMSEGGAHAVVVTAGSANAFTTAADMLRIGGVLSCVGIPPEKAFVKVPVSALVIKGLKITGNLVGNHKECLEAVDLVRRKVVKPTVRIRPFKDLPKVYEELEKGNITGRIVLKINEE